jgi:hypothetical protein
MVGLGTPLIEHAGSLFGYFDRDLAQFVSL